MNEPLSRQTEAALRGDCRMPAEALIVVGVSGGRDSIALLSLLHERKQPLIAAVFNHRLRPEAAEEQSFVEAFCRERGIRCLSGSADVSAYAAAQGLGIEAAARTLRYGFLFKAAEENGAAAVCTAHHANDRAETVLLHLLRGTGIDGLAALRPYSLPNPFSQSIPLIRPLLGVTRSQIDAYIAGKGLPFREDRSNADTAYTRNRIRAELIPTLERDYNPAIVSALCRLAESAAADSEILAADTEAARVRVMTAALPVTLSRTAYMAEAEGIRPRLLRLILPQVEAGFANLKALDEMIMSARVNETHPWMGDIQVTIEGDRVCFLTNSMRMLNNYPQLSDGYVLQIARHEVTKEDLPARIARAKADPMTAFLDADRVVGKLCLRTAVPGERFMPCGSHGHSQKLSDFWVNRKLPKRCRAEYPVLADDAGILWLPGFMTSERAALREETRALLEVRAVIPHEAEL